ncbi:MAG: hypothetical protein RQ731_07955 [Anaerosomatales bacterium]|nr:hypothetical protein [Anaerosomatales bacterium]
MSQKARVVALLAEASAIVASWPEPGASAPPAAAYPPPGAQAPPVPGAGGMTFDEARARKMPFGKFKDWTLGQIFDQGADGVKYLGWIKDKFGINDDGGEDPQYAAKNAQMRFAAGLVMSGGPASQVPPGGQSSGAYGQAAPPPYDEEPPF